MVGNLTAPDRPAANSSATQPGLVADCRISGRVIFRAGGRARPDEGAVVILIPKRTKPNQPLAPGLIMPETFVALDNPTIDSIHQMGGAAVRTNADGKFDVLVDRDREYRMLTLSKEKKSEGRKLSESQLLVLSKWFSPSEKIFRDNDFRWQDVNAASEEVDAGNIEFE